MSPEVGEQEERLRTAAARLEQIAAQLGSEQTDDAAAVALAQEAAELAAEVGAAASEAVRRAGEANG